MDWKACPPVGPLQLSIPHSPRYITVSHVRYKVQIRLDLHNRLFESSQPCISALSTRLSDERLDLILQHQHILRASSLHSMSTSEGSRESSHHVAHSANWTSASTRCLGGGPLGLAYTSVVVTGQPQQHLHTQVHVRPLLRFRTAHGSAASLDAYRQGQQNTTIKTSKTALMHLQGRQTMSVQQPILKARVPGLAVAGR